MFLSGVKDVKDGLKQMTLPPIPTPLILNCSSRFQTKLYCFEDLEHLSWQLNFHISTDIILDWLSCPDFFYLTSILHCLCHAQYPDTELHAFCDLGLTVENLQIKSIRNVCKTAKNRGQCENVMIGKALFSSWSHRQ